MRGRDDNFSPESWVGPELEGLRERALLREARTYQSIENDRYLNFASNDYLGLSADPRLIEAAATALREFGPASSASRVATGTTALHLELESALAKHMGSEAALVFSSGYLANLGAVTSLVGRNDIIIADKLVHASLIDGAILSRAKFLRFHHNDLNHLQDLLSQCDRERSTDQRILVITESVFSMDGDVAPVAEIAALAGRFGAMCLVDEAHAFGVFGRAGVGIAGMLNVDDRLTARTITFSKAGGSYGGAVLCSAPMAKLMINRARSFIYNTSLPPPVIASSLAALAILRDRRDMGRELLQRSKLFVEDCRRAGISVAEPQSQIIPVLCPGNKEVLAIAKTLEENGVKVLAVRAPTVPVGTERLRFSLTLRHSEGDISYSVDKLAQALLSVKQPERKK